MVRQRKKAPKVDYEVGYGRPPVSGQFKKGQPRPPRKKKASLDQSFEELIAEELKVMVSLSDEEGRERRMIKTRVLARSAINKAIKTGDLRNVREFLPKRQAVGAEQFSETDLAIIARFLASWNPEDGKDEAE